MIRLNVFLSKTRVPQWGLGMSRIFCCMFIIFLYIPVIYWSTFTRHNKSSSPSALQATLAAKNHLIEQLCGKASIELVQFIRAQWISILLYPTSTFQYYIVYLFDVWNYFNFLFILYCPSLQIEIVSTWIRQDVSRPVMCNPAIKGTALKTAGTFIAFTIAAPACFKPSHSETIHCHSNVPDSDFCILQFCNCIYCIMFCEFCVFFALADLLCILRPHLRMHSGCIFARLLFCVNLKKNCMSIDRFLIF